MKNKRGIAIEELLWWVIAAAIIVIIAVVAGYFKSRGISAIDYIKNLLKFG